MKLQFGEDIRRHD